MHYDVIIIGAGAAGLMCAAQAGKRGRSVLLLEHAEKIGKKILISGGGRCNFTNLQASPEQYLSNNEHFCKSALARFTQQDFIELVHYYGIHYHEKKLGQLFCDESSRQIVSMLEQECVSAGVEIQTSTRVTEIEKQKGFSVTTNHDTHSCHSVVVATGGISIPKMGATGFGYDIARQFGLSVHERKPGLVPFTFEGELLDVAKKLRGISLDVEISCNGRSFRENMLFTHRGVSGPAVLQISSFWNPGDEIVINLLPENNLEELLNDPLLQQRELRSLLSEKLPKRFVKAVFDRWFQNKQLGKLSEKERSSLISFFHSWSIRPDGTEGYRTAEVTVGGVDTNELSSKTFESNKVPGLYFIGEVIDVTGWLGGYNFQWAWASGYCAGQYV